MILKFAIKICNKRGHPAGTEGRPQIFGHGPGLFGHWTAANSTANSWSKSESSIGVVVLK